MARIPKKRMTEEEQRQWDALYEYVRTKVMGYDENQALSSHMVLRLKGMMNGKFMANNSTMDMAHYSYEVLLNTFKYSMPDIQRALNSVSFVDTAHKFNYVLKIVEGNLNDVYMRMKSAERAKEEVEDYDMSYASNYVNTFKPKEMGNNNNLSDLW